LPRKGGALKRALFLALDGTLKRTAERMEIATAAPKRGEGESTLSGIAKAMP
jgi:hypothetical protein